MPFHDYVAVPKKPAVSVSVPAADSNANTSAVTPAPVVSAVPVTPSAAANQNLVASATSGVAMWKKPDRSNYVRMTGPTLEASKGTPGPRCIGW